MPNHIRIQILHETVRKKIHEVKYFEDFSALLLTTISKEIQVHFLSFYDYYLFYLFIYLFAKQQLYSPNDDIIRQDSKVSGLFLGIQLIY